MSDADGFVKLSRQKAEGVKSWDMLEEAHQKDESVDGKITGKVKGGMTVNIGGVNAFLPGSQIDLKSLKNTDHLIGQNCTFKVINMNTKRSNVIVSRRLILEEQREKLRQHRLLGDERKSEVTLEEAKQIIPVLHDNRATEAELLQQAGIALFGHAALAGKQ